MSEGFNHREARRIVPRWRTSADTISQGELNPLSQKAPQERSDAEKQLEQVRFEKTRADWHRHRRVGFAQDFLSAAVTLDRSVEAHDAAAFILEHQDVTTPHAVQLASRVLASASSPQLPSLEAMQAQMKNLAIQGVRNSRQRVRVMPRNAVAWVDLARHYTALGLPDRAEPAIRVALSLAPDARFALRAASRFYTHVEGAEQALVLLRRSDATRSDPWLQAAEIAVAQVAGREPKYLSVGRRTVLAQDLPFYHLSELAAAVGSVELVHGSEKKAKKLFGTALREPTENAVAQVDWASRVLLGGMGVQAQKLEHPRAFEARAWGHYSASRWQEALSCCLAWLEDEPFSSRPAKFGSYVASVGLENFDLATGFTRLGLQTRPDDPMLLNNLAFELASADRAREAAQVLEKVTPRLIERSSLSPETRSSLPIVLAATAGLVAFRLGDRSQGTAGYETAVVLARAGQKPWYEASALLYLARELARVRDVGAVAALKRAEPLVKAFGTPSLGVLLGRVKASLLG